MIKKEDKVYLLTCGNKHPTLMERRLPGMADNSHEHELKNEEIVRRILSFYSRKIHEYGMDVTMIGCTGSPGTKICDAVKALKIDRVVIGRRSSGFLRSLVTPSTSRFVCDYSDSEVIVAKERKGSIDEETFNKMISESDPSLVTKSDESLAGGSFCVYVMRDKKDQSSRSESTQQQSSVSKSTDVSESKPKDTHESREKHIGELTHKNPSESTETSETKPQPTSESTHLGEVSESPAHSGSKTQMPEESRAEIDRGEEKDRPGESKQISETNAPANSPSSEVDLHKTPPQPQNVEVPLADV
jgi:nucleotide-binding universal stress UspA family protein